MDELYPNNPAPGTVVPQVTREDVAAFKGMATAAVLLLLVIAVMAVWCGIVYLVD